MPSIKHIRSSQVLNDEALDEARRECKAIEEAAEVAFLAEWTKEVTDERLAAWNHACVSRCFGLRTTKWSAIRAYEQAVGHTYEDLLSAVLYYYSEQYGDSAWVLPTNAAMTQVPRPTLGGKRVFLGPPIGHNITSTTRQRRPHYVGTSDYS